MWITLNLISLENIGSSNKVVLYKNIDITYLFYKLC